MRDNPVRVFGRRAPAGVPAPAAARTPPVRVVPRAPQEADEGEPQRQRVPRARGAALLAGLVIGCLYMGMALRAGAAPFPRISGLVAPSLDPAMALSAVAASGLLAGLRGAMGSLFVLRVGLNALGLTDLLAYTLAGGALAAIDGSAMQALGVGLPEHGLAFTAIAGAVCATLFRALAGVTRT